MITISPESVLSIFACVCIAVLMQSLSGFGFGLIVVASFTLFDLMPLTMTTLFVSVLGFVNSVGIVSRNLTTVDWPSVRLMLMTGFPFMILGFTLLEYLSQDLVTVLNVILGVCIIMCCLMMWFTKSTKQQQSGKASFLIAGGLGGVLGGMFSTFGPPVVFNCYRQPWSIQRIRSTLLAVFSVTAIFRISLVFFGTWPPHTLLLMILFSIPLVVMMTAISQRVARRVNPSYIRPIAAGLLCLSGVSILVSNVGQL